jgi:hypothetical protein
MVPEIVSDIYTPAIPFLADTVNRIRSVSTPAVVSPPSTFRQSIASTATVVIVVQLLGHSSSTAAWQFRRSERQHRRRPVSSTWREATELPTSRGHVGSAGHMCITAGHMSITSAWPSNRAGTTWQRSTAPLPVGAHLRARGRGASLRRRGWQVNSSIDVIELHSVALEQCRVLSTAIELAVAERIAK